MLWSSQCTYDTTHLPEAKRKYVEHADGYVESERVVERQSWVAEKRRVALRVSPKQVNEIITNVCVVVVVVWKFPKVPVVE